VDYTMRDQYVMEIAWQQERPSELDRIPFPGVSLLLTPSMPEGTLPCVEDDIEAACFLWGEPTSAASGGVVAR